MERDVNVRDRKCPNCGNFTLVLKTYGDDWSIVCRHCGYVRKVSDYEADRISQ